MNLNEGINIRDVEAKMAEAFEGCVVKTPPSMGDSFHAEVAFDEFELRVILTGRRGTPERQMYLKFIQKMPHGRKRVTRIIKEVRTQDQDELFAAIRECRAHILGIVHALTSAIRKKRAPTHRGVGSLFGED